jgi:hypothetical protein
MKKVKTAPHTTAYMIKDLATKLYSGGGSNPKFGRMENAKVWLGRGPLVRHILLLERRALKGLTQVDPATWYIEEYELAAPREISPFTTYPLDRIPQAKWKRQQMEARPRRTWSTGDIDQSFERPADVPGKSSTVPPTRPPREKTPSESLSWIDRMLQNNS